MVNKHSFRKTCYRIFLYIDATLTTVLVCLQPQLSAHVPQPVLAVLACVLWLLAVLLFHLSTLAGRNLTLTSRKSQAHTI